MQQIGFKGTSVDQRDKLTNIDSLSLWPPKPSFKLIPARGPLKKTLDKTRDSAALAWKGCTPSLVGSFEVDVSHVPGIWFLGMEVGVTATLR